MKKVLFVCRGNVGRSQMAEALLHNVSREYQVASAGTKLSGPEETIGNLLPATENVISAMKELGIDISSAMRKNITPQMVDDADVVVLTIDVNDPVPEYVAKSKKTILWNIPDPKGKTIEETRFIRDTIQTLLSQYLNSNK